MKIYTHQYSPYGKPLPWVFDSEWTCKHQAIAHAQECNEWNGQRILGENGEVVWEISGEPPFGENWGRDV